MPDGAPHAEEAEIEAIFATLREEVRARQPSLGGEAAGAPAPPLLARRQAQRLWAVTAERPYLYKPGLRGRVRGLALVPVKAVLRRLMRWYVEPLATDQRAFNAAMLRVADELGERLSGEVGRLERALERLDERLSRLEGREAPSPPRPGAPS